MEKALVSGLDKVREMVAMDGVDLELVNVKSGVVRVRLLLTPEACEECIVPREILERIILQELKKEVPTLVSIELMDPRSERSTEA